MGITRDISLFFEESKRLFLKEREMIVSATNYVPAL